MSTQIFVNLPVKDLEKSKKFFGALGFKFNPQFTDENAACMIISDDIYAMLLSIPTFQGFAPNPVADASKTTEVLIALSRENSAAVDSIVRDAVAAGGKTYKEPQDYGFMYSHGFQDPDGHVWEVLWMDPAHVQPVEAEAVA